MYAHKFICSTLRILLGYGVEPNERLDFIDKSCPQAVELNGVIGYTPLQILAASALLLHDTQYKELGTTKDDKLMIKSSTIKTLSFYIEGCAEVLIRNGARLAVDTPSRTRPSREGLSKYQDKIANDHTLRSLLPDREGISLHLEKNKVTVKSFGGIEKIEMMSKAWSQNLFVRASRDMVLHEKPVSAHTLDSDTSGGSHHGNCAICWTVFGMIRNRRHLCRSSLKYVCEECSTKSVVQSKEPRRVSDGQFAAAIVSLEREKEGLIIQQKKKTEMRKLRFEKTRATSKSCSSDRGSGLLTDSPRGELFAGAVNKVKNLFMEDVSGDSTNEVNSLTNSMNQTKDALNERGERLNTLSDKTSALKDASADFSKMAKELKEAQKGGLFW